MKLLKIISIIKDNKKTIYEIDVSDARTYRFTFYSSDKNLYDEMMECSKYNSNFNFIYKDILYESASLIGMNHRFNDGFDAELVFKKKIDYTVYKIKTFLELVNAYK